MTKAQKPETEKPKTDKQGAPECGLYYAADISDGADVVIPKLREIAFVINRSSGYTRNMNIIEITGADEMGADVLQSLAITIKELGFVAILRGDYTTAHACDFDGVALKALDEIASARSIIGEQGIIGLHCGSDWDMAENSLKHVCDFVTFGITGYEYPSPKLIEKWSQSKTDNLCVALGHITNDTCGFYVQAGASFVDATRYIDEHTESTMKATVNMLHAIELAAA